MFITFQNKYFVYFNVQGARDVGQPVRVLPLLPWLRRGVRERVALPIPGLQERGR